MEEVIEEKAKNGDMGSRDRQQVVESGILQEAVEGGVDTVPLTQ